MFITGFGYNVFTSVVALSACRGCLWLRSPAKQVPYISTTIKRELNNRNSVT